MSYNDFALVSLAEINSFVRANEEPLEDLDVSSMEWLIIDQKGLETSTCLVCMSTHSVKCPELFGPALPFFPYFHFEALHVVAVP
ncbi:hypothetical protein DFH06DRAFT_1330009 [Mycena polygramma]|nr:hypothetical protein DFH06DRAFT_1330009 [Mycena polygramma]